MLRIKKIETIRHEKEEELLNRMLSYAGSSEVGYLLRLADISGRTKCKEAFRFPYSYNSSHKKIDNIETMLEISEEQIELRRRSAKIILSQSSLEWWINQLVHRRSITAFELADMIRAVTGWNNVELVLDDTPAVISNSEYTETLRVSGIDN